VPFTAAMPNAPRAAKRGISRLVIRMVFGARQAIKAARITKVESDRTWAKRQAEICPLNNNLDATPFEANMTAASVKSISLRLPLNISQG